MNKIRRFTLGLALIALPVMFLALETAPVCGACRGI